MTRLFPQFSKTTFVSVSLAVTVVITSSIGLASCSGNTSETQAADMIEQAALVSELTVYRSPTCGCCGKWIAYMEAQGFRIKDEITEEMDVIKEQYGVPQTMASCHTTVANGYVIEGHIPAVDVARLMTEKPDISGIAVPGMPIGSPGMESGDYIEPYTVFSFNASGEIASFAEHL